MFESRRLREAREEAARWEASAAGWMQVVERQDRQMDVLRAEIRRLQEKLYVISREQDRRQR